jgi:NitT/TauT family transport system substrate-binding protein
MADNCAGLLRGDLDVVQVFEPFASSLIESGQGYIWYAAASRGLTSYTTFYARRGLLSARRDELQRMVRAIYRTQQWVAVASAADIAAQVGRYFAAVEPSLLTAACARYKALGVWATDPVMQPAGYDRLLASLTSGGFVQPGTPFEVAVDNSLAEAVVAEGR